MLCSIRQLVLEKKNIQIWPQLNKTESSSGRVSESDWREGVAFRRTKHWIGEIKHFLFRRSCVQKYWSTSHIILQNYVQI